MFILNVLFMSYIGAIVGRLMAITVDHLPLILLEDYLKGKEPRDVIRLFLQRVTCSHCHKQINSLHSLPFLGYLLSNGQCIHCQQALSKPHFLMEAGVALLFGLTVLFFGLDLATLFVLAATCILICAFMTDRAYGILPDQLTLLLLWIALAASLVPLFVDPKDAIIGAILGYTLPWLLNEIFMYLRGNQGMFPGDFKLIAAIGAIIGFQQLIPTLVLSFVLVVITTVIKLIALGRIPDKNDLQKEIPYGCYAALVTIALLYLKLAGFFA